MSSKLTKQLNKVKKSTYKRNMKKNLDAILSKSRKRTSKYADGGKPIGSTGLFADGGKPLGSTMLADGGILSKLPYKKSITLGKIDYDDRGRKINEVEISVTIKLREEARNWDTLEEVHNVPEFSASCGFWNGRKSDIIAGGQMLDEIPAFFPKDKKLKKLISIWEKYHLNDVKAGTKKQTEAVEAWEKEGNKYEYEAVVAMLKEKGLYDDRGYKYGHGWLYKPLPESVIEEAIEIADSYKDFSHYEEGGQPLGSTGLFADGGQPLGSTMLAEGGTASKWDDEVAARDVELFAENDEQLYKSRWVPILKNLKKKKDKGVFDVAKAAILMKYFVDDADKRYQIEINGEKNPKGYFLSVNDRKLLSKKLAEDVAGMSDADMSFEDGGKPLGSTMLAEGGQPLGSTMLEKGGITKTRINTILNHYKVAALWSSTDSETEDPLDANYDSSDIAEPTARKMRDNVTNFVTENEKDIEESGLEDSQLGHSLWLTQNHHGAGFFDFSMDKEVEDRLTKTAHELGEMSLYIGDDGKIWGFGSEDYAKGGSTDTTATDDAQGNIPVPGMARGGSANDAGKRIANQEANTFSEHKLPFRGNNLEGKMLDNGDYVVLSYGYYPIWYWNSREAKWYGNSTKYSVTTSKHLTQSRPDWNAEMLEKDTLLEKMKNDDARFDLGGLMIQNLYPIGDKALPTDNTLIAHGQGTGIAQQ